MKLDSFWRFYYKFVVKHSSLPSALRLLPTAFRPLPLPTAYCLLRTAFCLLPSAYCLPPTAFGLLPSAYCLPPTALCFQFSPAPKTSPVHAFRRPSRSRRPPEFWTAHFLPCSDNPLSSVYEN